MGEAALFESGGLRFVTVGVMIGRLILVRIREASTPTRGEPMTTTDRSTREQAAHRARDLMGQGFN